MDLSETTRDNDPRGQDSFDYDRRVNNTSDPSVAEPDDSNDREIVADGGQPAASDDAALESYEPEPQRFAEVHVTVSGAMQFIDDDQPGRWMTSDTVVEVTR